MIGIPVASISAGTIRIRRRCRKSGQRRSPDRAGRAGTLASSSARQASRCSTRLQHQGGNHQHQNREQRQQRWPSIILPRSGRNGVIPAREGSAPPLHGAAAGGSPD
jgi:hypothetical protein